GGGAGCGVERGGVEGGVGGGGGGQESDLEQVRRDERWSTLADFLRKCNRYWATSDHHDTSLVLPKGYTRGKPIPVLVGLHGMGGNATGFVGRAFQYHADALGVAFVGVSGSIPRAPRSFVCSQDTDRHPPRIDPAPPHPP